VLFFFCLLNGATTMSTPKINDDELLDKVPVTAKERYDAMRFLIALDKEREDETVVIGKDGE